MAESALEERAIKLAEEVHGFVIREIGQFMNDGAINGRGTLGFMETEAPQYVDYLLQQAGLPATRVGLEQLAATLERGAEFNPRISRRNLFKLGAIVVASKLLEGCVTNPSTPSYLIKPELVVDLTETLKQNQSLYPKDSKCAPVVFYRFRQDFIGHLVDRPRTLAGIDFHASASTIIVAAEDGFIVKIEEKNPRSGNKIWLYHGFGIRTLYGHLDELFFKKEDLDRDSIYVTRCQPLGKGGSGGSTTINYTHNHLTLFGPDYTPILRPFRENRHFQDTEDTSNGNVWRYPVDGELFSALKGCLPHYRSNINLGKPLIEKSKEAQPIVYRMIDMINKNELGIEERQELDALFKRDKFADWYWRNKGLDIYIDRKVSFLYKLINKSNPPFKDTIYVSKELIRLMKTMVPVLTAPV